MKDERDQGGCHISPSMPKAWAKGEAVESDKSTEQKVMLVSKTQKERGRVAEDGQVSGWEGRWKSQLSFALNVGFQVSK